MPPSCIAATLRLVPACKAARLFAVTLATCPSPLRPRAGDSGRPGLVSLVPGGTITYENRNLFGNAASVGASVTTKNFLAPADDLSFRVQFNQVRRLAGYQPECKEGFLPSLLALRTYLQAPYFCRHLVPLLLHACCVLLQACDRWDAGLALKCLPPASLLRPCCAALHVRPGRPQAHPPLRLAVQRPQDLRRVHARCGSGRSLRLPGTACI